MTTVTETHLSGARLSRRGKVRELYDLGASLLLVASDRISAFDVVLSPGIPDKGKILTQLSNFWFRKFSDVENHLIETDIARFPEELRADAPLLAGRSVLVKKCEVSTSRYCEKPTHVRGKPGNGGVWYSPSQKFLMNG